MERGFCHILLFFFSFPHAQFHANFDPWLPPDPLADCLVGDDTGLLKHTRQTPAGVVSVRGTQTPHTGSPASAGVQAPTRHM